MTAKDDPATRQAAGRWLREERRRHGYETMGEFARALGVDPSRVSNYETGKAKVPDDRADQIAELFHLPVLEVRRNLGLWVPDDSPEPEPRRPTAKQIAELEDLLDRATEALRRLKQDEDREAG